MPEEREKKKKEKDQDKTKRAPFHLLQRHQMPFLLAEILIAYMEDQQPCTFFEKILVRLFFLCNTEL